MSDQPTRAVRPSRAYPLPAVTNLLSTDNSSSSLVEQLRSTLKQLDNILNLNPNDSAATEFHQTLRRTLAEQGSHLG